MRMWNVNPSLLCKKHLLGEHLETHMFLGSIRKGISIKGYINNGLLEVHNLNKRHDELVEEMIKRGYNHKTPMERFNSWEEGIVDSNENLNELQKRCSECKKRILNM